MQLADPGVDGWSVINDQWPREGRAFDQSLKFGWSSPPITDQTAINLADQSQIAPPCPILSRHIHPYTALCAPIPCNPIHRHFTATYLAGEWYQRRIVCWTMTRKMAIWLWCHLACLWALLPYRRYCLRPKNAPPSSGVDVHGHVHIHVHIQSQYTHTHTYIHTSAKTNTNTHSLTQNTPLLHCHSHVCTNII